MGHGQETDRRRHARYPLNTRVGFYHAPTQREFPARCANISQSGMMMYVPAATPVQPGQPIRVSVDAVYRPELAGLSGEPIDGTVVRVDRMAMMRSGHLAVGVRFRGA